MGLMSTLWFTEHWFISMQRTTREQELVLLHAIGHLLELSCQIYCSWTLLIATKADWFRAGAWENQELFRDGNLCNWGESISCVQRQLVQGKTGGELVGTKRRQWNLMELVREMYPWGWATSWRALHPIRQKWDIRSLFYSGAEMRSVHIWIWGIKQHSDSRLCVSWSEAGTELWLGKLCCALCLATSASWWCS